MNILIKLTGLTTLLLSTSLLANNQLRLQLPVSINSMSSPSDVPAVVHPECENGAEKITLALSIRISQTGTYLM
jgi:hypothetical protein